MNSSVAALVFGLTVGISASVAMCRGPDNNTRKSEAASAAARAVKLVPERRPGDVAPAAIGLSEALTAYHRDLAFRLFLKGKRAEEVKAALERDVTPPAIWSDKQFRANRQDNLQRIAAERVAIMIVGGTESCEPMNKEFSDVVNVYQTGETGSGTIICDGVVLTARHCVPDPKAKTFITLDCDGLKRVAVDCIIHYPGQLDLAIVLTDPQLLQRPVARTWASKADISAAKEICCVGFGATGVGGGGLDGKRRLGRGMTVVSSDCYCNPTNASVADCVKCVELISESGIKDDDGNVVDVCKGDSGGPMLVLVSGKYCLGGVTRDNRTPLKPGDLCGAGGYFVRLDTAEVRKWIKDTLKRHNRDCGVPGE